MLKLYFVFGVRPVGVAQAGVGAAGEFEPGDLAEFVVLPVALVAELAAAAYLLTEDLAFAVEDEFSKNQRETAAWINRLDYLIGRTQLSLRGQVSQIDGRHYQLLYFQARRYFGRFAQ